MKRIIITGLDRSGTSMVAEIIHRLTGALHFDEIHKSHWNPRGYFESMSFRLCATESARNPRAFRLWVAARKNKPLWAVKEPRLCYALPHLLREFDEKEDVRVVVCRRPFRAIQASWRNCKSEQNFAHKARALLVSLRAARAKKIPLVYAHFDRIIEDPGAGVCKLVADLELDATPEQIESAALAVDPTLRHYT